MKRIIITGISLVALVAFGLYMRHIIPETIQPRKAGQQYVVSLGDSVAAGAGLGDSNHPSACSIATAAYPYLVGTQLHKPIEQFACSGATISTSGPHSLLGQQYQQAKAVLTGSYVLITAGANDIGWLQALAACAQSSCNGVDLQPKIHTMQQNLTKLLQQVQQAKPARIVVNSYYDLLKTGDTCFAKVGITPDKIAFIRQEEAALNNAIAAAAQAANATAVRIDFSGHLLCDATPWIQSLQSPAPLHPTAAGQQQIARQDTAALLADN